MSKQYDAMKPDEKQPEPIPMDSPPPGGMIPSRRKDSPVSTAKEAFTVQYFYHIVVQITLPGSIKMTSLRMTLNDRIRNETYEGVRQVLAERFMHPVESIVILSWQEMDA